MNTPSTKLITYKWYDEVCHVVEELKNSKKIIPYLKNHDLWEEVRRDGMTDGEALYLYINKMTNAPVCASGNPVKFISFSVGYRFCGTAAVCTCVRSRVAAKVKAAYVAKNDEVKTQIKEKRTSTVQDRFGCANVFQNDAVKSKITSTMMERYGASNPMQVDEIVEKASATLVNRYGVTNPMQSDRVKAEYLENFIERYGVTNPMQVDEFRQKHQATILSKYGHGNPQQVDSIRTKTRHTIIDRYGVSNVARNNEIRSKITCNRIFASAPRVLERLKQFVTLLSDYQGSWAWHEWRCNHCGTEFVDMTYNGRIPRCLNCYPKHISKPQREIEDFVKGLGIEVVSNDRRVIAPYELDIFMPAHDVAIEYCGLYWHSENKLGKQYHLNKLNYCENKGIQLITIFEDEWIEKRDIVQRRLAHILRKSTHAIPARKTVVREVDAITTADFYTTYHIQGTAKTSVNLGLWDETNNLVAMMSFSRLRFEKGQEGWFELVRYASAAHVIGGASKLLKHFIKIYDPTGVISYADRRWSRGNLYEAIGFDRVSNTTPGYYYFLNKQRYSRQRFMKHKLVEAGADLNKTEQEIMREAGYGRIWDCGHIKFQILLKGN